MSLKYHLTITGLLFLASCSNVRKVSKDVDQLSKQLPQIQLPITFNSDRKVKYPAIDLEGNEIIKRLIDQNSFSLFGKLFENKTSITMLGYLPDNNGTPVVITVDNNGRSLKSHALYETTKSGFGYHTSNIAMVFSNRQIIFTDSTVLQKIYHAGLGQFHLTDSVSVTRKKYLIAGNGTIKILN